MRILFMGTPEFALPSLKILLDHRYDVVGVVTAVDKPKGRGQKIGPSRVKEFAVRQGLVIFQPDRLDDPGFVASIASLEPDIIVVVAFRILPPAVYNLAKRGTFNLHASLLPKYRGAAPINWAIMNGETETGVTTFLLRETVDTGSIILQARVKVGRDETAGELHDRLAEVGAEIVLQTVRLIELGKAEPRPQDDSLATPAPKISKDGCRIAWTKEAIELHNFVRGLAPTPAAWTTHRRAVLRIFKTSVDIRSMNAQSATPGEVAFVDAEHLLIQSGAELISILELQQEGRRRMNIAEFLRGYTFEVGDRLE